MTEEFDNKKLELYNSEQIGNIKNNPVVKTTIVTLIKSIPLLGELVDGTIDECITKFQENKRNELLDIILSDSQNITTDMVNDVEFIMNLAKTIEAINRLASNDKVKYFASVIKNGYFSNKKIVENEFEEYLFALSTLSYRQINILIDLYNHEKNNLEVNEKEKDISENKLQSRSKLWNKFINEVTSKYLISKEDVLSILASISKTGFCNEITGAYFGYTGGVFYCTNICKKFVEMILC